MTPALALGDRRPWLLGLALGIYAVLAAIAPGLSTKIVLAAPLLGIALLWPLLSSATAWILLFFACALLAPPLPIALGNSGPHPAMLFAAIGMFCGLLRLRDWRFRVASPGLAMLLLFAVLLASISMAALYSDYEIAAASLARVFLFGIGVYLFFYVSYGPARRAWQSFGVLRLLFWIAVASALFACVDFYFQFPAPAGYGPQFIWLATGVFRRAQGIFYEASTLGNFCAFFLEMIAVAVLRPRDRQPLSPAAMLFGGATLGAALVLSYSRASLVNLGVAVIALLWMHRARIRWRRLIAGTVLFGGAAAALLAALFPVFASAYLERVSAAVQYFGEAPNAVLSGRLQSWQLLTDFLSANPAYALLGIGYKTLPYSDFIGTTVVADNTYLGLLVETGIAGLAAVVALNIAILRVSYRAARSGDAVRSFCGAWMFCFWAGQTVQMFSGDLLTYWRVLPVYFFVLALATRTA